MVSRLSRPMAQASVAIESPRRPCLRASLMPVVVMVVVVLQAAAWVDAVAAEPASKRTLVAPASVATTAHANAVAQAPAPAPESPRAAAPSPDTSTSTSTDLEAAVRQVIGPKPRKYTLRCWQHGRLIIERLIHSIPAGTGDMVRLGETDAASMALFERRGSICIVE